MSTDLASLCGTLTSSSSSFSERERRLRQLVQRGDQLGALMQIRSKGFLSNQRQWRQFGMAVLSVAQEIQDWWQRLSSSSKSENKREKKEIHRSTLPDEARSSLPNAPFTYRDIADVAVRWRQVSEPNDPVWWIDLLTKEAFHEGFGLQTPLVTGQTHVPRYYPYFEQALQRTKELVLEQIVLTDEQRLKVEAATDCATLYKAVGSHDFWVCTTCRRVRRGEARGEARGEERKEEKVERQVEEETPRPKLVGVYDRHGFSDPDELPIEGTRLTLVEHDPDGFEFTIRMPGLPMRYAQYHEVMMRAFEDVRLIVCCGGGMRATETTLEPIVRACATVFYYWVTWAPLTRGSAATAYVMMYGLLLASGVVVHEGPPPGVQADWEAILQASPIAFVDRICSCWLLVDGVVSLEGKKEGKKEGKDDDGTLLLADTPRVKDMVKTLRHMIEVLNVDMSPPSMEDE